MGQTIEKGGIKLLAGNGDGYDRNGNGGSQNSEDRCVCIYFSRCSRQLPPRPSDTCRGASNKLFTLDGSLSVIQKPPIAGSLKHSWAS